MPAKWELCEAVGHIGPERDATVRWRDLGLMCDTCDAAHGDIRPLREALAEIATMLGSVTRECSDNNCGGCKREMREARRIAQEALG